jgi:hypothetical protein
MFRSGAKWGRVGRERRGSSGSKERERLVCGIGIDIVEVARVAGAAERHGERFLRRIYTPLELERVHGNREQYLAARSGPVGEGACAGSRWRWTTFPRDSRS